MKIKSLVALGATASLFGVSTFLVLPSAKASVWHEGTPETLRGAWAHKDKAPLGSDSVYITKAIFDWNSSGMPGHLCKHPHWKYLGVKKYLIAGRVSANPGVTRSYYEKMTIGRRGRYLVMYNVGGNEYFHRVNFRQY